MAKRPPKHIVDMTLSANDMARVGAALNIQIFSQDRRRNKTILGTIQIGQGSFRWARAKRKAISRKNAIQVSKSPNQGNNGTDGKDAS